MKKREAYNMTFIENGRYDAERAFYGSEGVTIKNSAFDGPADGESAFKESRNITAESCYFNLRYPFWHCDNVKVDSSEMTELCRAALWYSSKIEVKDSLLHGIKALRECSDVKIRGCDIVSPEFGWSVSGADMISSSAESEYFMMRSEDLHFDRVKLKGKYSFQYVKNALIENCYFDTKDSFWHAENVIVRNSTIKGEYLAWYCKNVTFESCRIIGTQPFCYCDRLTLIDCEMLDADLCFEKSDVNATLISPLISIKNPRSGVIRLPEVGEIIMDDAEAQAQIAVG